jgi:hypothetical protein
MDGAGEFKGPESGSASHGTGGHNDADVAMNWRLGRQRALGDIARDLAVTDPRLDALFLSFNQRACGRQMPRTEKIRASPLGLIARIGRRVRPPSDDFKSMAGWWL